MLKCTACRLLVLTGWADVRAMSVPGHGFQADASSASLHTQQMRCHYWRHRLMLLRASLYKSCVWSEHASEVG